jgi:deoxyribonuclease-4
VPFLDADNAGRAGPMIIGAHVSSSGSFDLAVDRALKIGAEAIQTFAGAPQNWADKRFKPGEADEFRAKAAEHHLGPTMLHAIYLSNLASADETILTKSIASLKASLHAAHLVGACGVIFHTGSHKGLGFEETLEQICESMVDVLKDTPDDTWLIIENSAGSGHTIGSQFWQLGKLVNGAGSPRVRVCLDTAHTFASGYDIKTPEGVEKTMEEFDSEVGLDRLVAVHANDSKAALGSGVDRHENIGDGLLGAEGFAAILSHPAFKDVPFYLEVPGYEKQGPDEKNVSALKAIRDRVATR